MAPNTSFLSLPSFNGFGGFAEEGKTGFCAEERLFSSNCCLGTSTWPQGSVLLPASGLLDCASGGTTSLLAMPSTAPRLSHSTLLWNLSNMSCSKDERLAWISEQRNLTDCNLEWFQMASELIM
eukprot:CAMPEP_0180670834 /NCGR_PEP_ID=MMETSP1037_2-20121125/64250_1 /TAXON_ID=632150 /ORGANISM="Azadinium spinosum, Strain 3D9" /LENGTH=123 /DNA_ID=CAMNT_0022699817 /DNA_START=71 /DNA_END=442 /DNA_ORIENTATION=-